MNFKSSYNNGKFFNYLNKDNNGSFESLKQTITNLEKSDKNFSLYRFIMNRHGNIIYEIPTNELCKVLL